MPCASFSMFDGPGGLHFQCLTIPVDRDLKYQVFENDAHGIEKLLLQTQVS